MRRGHIMQTGRVVFTALLFMAAAGCQPPMPGERFRGSDYGPRDGELAEQLRADIQHLADTIGPRNVKHPQNLDAAADYIDGQLRQAGYEVRRQSFSVGEVVCSNLIAELPGTHLPEQIVILGAHYDTVKLSPGANDNGSGVASVLALARRFVGRPQDRTLRFVLFVNEESPYFQTGKMGSLVYARRCRDDGEQVSAMVNLDTIGYYSDAPGSQKYPPPIKWLYPDTGDFIAFLANLNSKPLLLECIGAFREQTRFASEGTVAPALFTSWSDQWSFWHVGYPAVMVTDTGPFRYPYYHDPADTPDKVDVDRLATVTLGLERVIEKLASEE